MFQVGNRKKNFFSIYHRKNFLYAYIIFKDVIRIVSRISNHSWQKVNKPPILWRPLYCFSPPYPSTPHSCSFCCLAYMAEFVITPDLVYYFALWYYVIDPWYLNTSSTLLCVSCNKESNSLKVWHRWLGFYWYPDVIITYTHDTQQTTDWHT